MSLTHADYKILEAINRLQIPLITLSDENIVEIVQTVLSGLSIESTEYPVVINYHTEQWKEEQRIPDILKNIITELLQASLSESYEQYISLYKNDFFKRHILDVGIPFNTGLAFLNKTQLIITLAQQKMTPAKIFTHLANLDPLFDDQEFKDLVAKILAKFNLKPNVTREMVAVVIERDKIDEPYLLADLDIATACEYISGFIYADSPQEASILENCLKELWNDGNTHYPYLQILHFQSAVSQYYNHDAAHVYDFKPRGQSYEPIDELYSHVSTSNAFLNNLKNVHVLDEGWAKAKELQYRKPALALVKLLKILGNMNFNSSRWLAKWLRVWMLRVIKIQSSEVAVIDAATIDAHSIDDVSKYIKSEMTSTFGVLEQRFVDFIATLRHPDPTIWRPRGLHDSVFAPNVAKKKLGDCDFQNPHECVIYAYEAHGGILTEMYLQGHIKTLKRSLRKRIAELEGIANASEWTANIIFIAYDFKVELPEEMTIEDVTVRFHFEKFSEVEILGNPLVIKDAFIKHFIEPLNELRSPQFVRDAILEILNFK